MERKEILNPSSCKVGDHVKDLESQVAVNLLCNCFVIEDFGSNRTSIAMENAWRVLALKVRRDFILDGLLDYYISKIY